MNLSFLASDRWRRAAIVVVLLGGLWVFADILHGHYPLQHWLFFRYASHWAAALTVGLCCWLGGAAALRRFGVVLPRGERALMQFALGFYLFFAAMFVGGLLKLYGPAFALALPALMAGLGTWDALPRLRRCLPVLRRALGRPVRFGSPLAVLIILFGIGGLLLVYFPILTPDNAAADTRWYHLTRAEHYAAEGGIARSPEGSYPAAYPQLATIVYTWAFLLPRTALFDRIEIAAHLEFMVFLWTLVGVGVLARRLVPQCRAGLAWTAMFLFPGVFLYDSNLSIAADHVLAFWAAPIFLTLLRAWPTLEPRRCLLLAVMLAGAALTKYQAGCLVVLPALALAARGLWLLARARGPARAWAWRGPLAAGAFALLLTAPHWAKNAVWYHDPFYPLLHQHLPSTPWSEDAAVYFQRIFRANLWAPLGTLGERLHQTGKALFTFSFIPNDWPAFHGAVPVFGSLFTLTSLCVPFFRRERRLLALVLCCYGGVFIWYWGSHQDRYLQALLPWMAAATAATLAKLWHSGLLVKAATTLLVALQIAWGGDVPFIPTHVFIGTTPFKTAIDLLSTGHRKDYLERLRPFPSFWKLGRKLPEGARVVVHGDLGPLGMGAMTITDMTGWQGGISYGRHRSPAETHRLLRSMGATHVLWMTDWAPQNNSLADDLVFYAFAHHHLPPATQVDAYHLTEMPAREPADRPFDPVLVWGNGEPYASGLHRMEALTVPGAGRQRRSDYPPPLRAAGEDPGALVKHAGFIVVDTTVARPFSLDGFTRLLRRGNQELWARTPGTAVAPL